MARKTKLTPELITQVCEYIRQGAYDYIACERVGISQSVFYLWLQQAEAEDADPLLLEFLESVEQARAEARSNAEIAVLADQPATWLLKGPGREKPGRPGWTNESTLNLQPGDGAIRLTWSDADGETTGNSTAAPAPGATPGQG
jgi:transposase-like protein